MKSVLRALLAGVLVVAACTRPNPAFVGLPADAAAADDLGGAAGSGAVDAVDDVARAPDAAAVTADVAVSDVTAGRDAVFPDLAVADRVPPPQGDAAPVGAVRYSFEASLQGWADLRYQYYGVSEIALARSTAHATDGDYALEVPMMPTSKTSHPTIGISQHFTDLPAGTVITYHLWLPAGAVFTYVQPYVFYYHGNTGEPIWGGIDPPLFPADLKLGQWNVITHRVPADVDSRGVLEVGMEFDLAGKPLTVYLDAIGW